MRMSISRKLISGFLSLALFVLISGLVGIFVLNKLSSSTDTIAREKAPLQYAVMNAALAVDMVQKYTISYTSADFNLEEISSQIIAQMEEFDMWIAMLQYGSASKEFRNSPAQSIYQRTGLNLVVPRCSAKMLPIVTNIVKESGILKSKTAELIAAHKEEVSFGVIVDSQLLKLPDFLNLAQRDHLDWTKQLKDAVNIETKFTGNTDPTAGIIGKWLESYQVPNQKLMDVHAQFKKQYAKLMAMAQKINSLTVYKDKQRTLNRGIGTISKIERYFIELHKISKEIYSEIEAADKQKQSELAVSVRSINDQLSSLITVAEAEMRSALEDAATAKKSGTTILIVLTIVAVVAATLLGMLVSRTMSSRILSIAESTKKIAAGDLHTDLNINSNDELGDLAHDTNAMIVNLRQMIGQILSFSGKLTTSAVDLAGVSQDLDVHTNDLENKSADASAATATMNNSMAEISVLANDSMQRVQSVAIATDEMSSTISEIAQNAEQARSVTSKAVNTVENTTLKMNELSEAAHKIGMVADVIVSIAEQTNLLSLNATIEAARAGEAGKGFAVVANEVKELAGQTNKATEDIREKITAIQQSSNVAISEISEISRIISEINSIVVVIAGAVEEQAVTTKQITEDINSVSGGIEGMSQHVDSATEISDSVALDIDHVKTTSKSIGEGSHHIQENVMGLEKLAEELNGLVSQFKL
jgi:methyl-accepting chemotaxis protein